MSCFANGSPRISTTDQLLHRPTTFGILNMTTASDHANNGRSRSKRRLDFSNEVPQGGAKSVTTPATCDEITLRSEEAVVGKSPSTAASSKSSTTPIQKRIKRAIVTPGDEEDEVKEPQDFVPVHVHKNLDYAVIGTTNLPATTIRAFKLVRQTHIIPRDLQSSRMHGPLSGSSYEENVLQAYALNRLQPKDEFKGNTFATTICMECAVQGHGRDDCPLLL